MCLRAISSHGAGGLVFQWYNTVVGVGKMGIIVPRGGSEPTSLAFWARMLPLHHVGSLMSSLYPRQSVYTAPCLRGQFRLLHLSPWNCMSFTYIQAMAVHIYIYIYIYTGQGQQPYSPQHVQDPGHSTSIMGVTKMGNIVPRVGIEPTSLAFQASVLPFHHISSLLSLLYPCMSPDPVCLDSQPIEADKQNNIYGHLWINFPYSKYHLG